MGCGMCLSAVGADPFGIDFFPFQGAVFTILATWAFAVTVLVEFFSSESALMIPFTADAVTSAVLVGFFTPELVTGGVPDPIESVLIAVTVLLDLSHAIGPGEVSDDITVARRAVTLIGAALSCVRIIEPKNE